MELPGNTSPKVLKNVRCAFLEILTSFLILSDKNNINLYTFSDNFFLYSYKILDSF